MAQLAINFTPVSGITSYDICYKPVGEGTFTCIESAGPITITTGIECGVEYDVTVRTNCSTDEYLTAQSPSVVTIATALECLPECISYTISTSSANALTSAYVDCDGVIQQVTVGGVSGYDASTFCARANSVIISGDCQLVNNGICEPVTGTTVTVMGAGGYMEPCIGGTIDDHMGATVYLDNPVTVDTLFDVIVKWSNLNTSCNFPYEQSFSVEVLAGQSSSNFVACNQGYYMSSGANICGALVTGHNNTVDTIILP